MNETNQNQAKENMKVVSSEKTIELPQKKENLEPTKKVEVQKKEELKKEEVKKPEPKKEIKPEKKKKTTKYSEIDKIIEDDAEEKLSDGAKDPFDVIKEKEEIIKKLQAKVNKKDFFKTKEIFEKSCEGIETGVEYLTVACKSSGKFISNLFENTKLKSRIPILKNRIEKQLIKLGAEVYDLNLEGKKDVLNNDEVKKIISKVQKLNDEIKDIKEKLTSN